MVVYGDFTAKHAYRLQQLTEPVCVLFRTAKVSLKGLRLLGKIARLYRQHTFVFVLRRSYLDGAVGEEVNKVRRLKNVFYTTIEDKKDPTNIMERRYEQLYRLTRRAREAAPGLAVQAKSRIRQMSVR